MADSSFQQPHAIDWASDSSWWRRYSRHGEFFWSAGMAVLFHGFLVVLVLVLSIQVIQHDPTPPAADVLVYAEDEAARGTGDEETPGDQPMAKANDEPQPKPDEREMTKIEKVDAPTPVKIDVATVDTGTEIKEAVDAAQAAQNAVKNARDQLSKNLQKNRGGGGSKDASSPGARAARWILRHHFRDSADYMRQVEGLGATVAFPTSHEKWRYFDRPSSERGTGKVRDLSSESRLYWMCEERETAVLVANFFGITPTPYFVLFLPKALEDRMMQMEKDYKGLEEDEIRSTTFECFDDGGKYDVKVVRQIPK